MEKTDRQAIVIILLTFAAFIGLKWYIDRTDINACMQRGDSYNYCVSKVAN